MQDLQNQTLIYDLVMNKALCLTETSAFFWQKCNGQKEISQIAQNLAGNGEYVIRVEADKAIKYTLTVSIK